LIIRRAALLGAIGVSFGVAGAAALETSLGKLLPGVSGFDPWNAAPSFLVSFAVTLAASAVLAWRISRLDPAVTLRQD
jgi:ABC-type antimicrobial peptide transport system permease subunit